MGGVGCVCLYCLRLNSSKLCGTALQSSSFGHFLWGRRWHPAFGDFPLLLEALHGFAILKHVGPKYGSLLRKDTTKLEALLGYPYDR
jgi:hypothetical protein